jgi:spermidine synthase
MARNKKTAIELPEVSVSDDGEVRHLHLGTPWIQGSMRVAEPFEIELQYVQRMMAWLLFVEPASVTKRHAMQLGLGAGAITKFCHKKLRLCTTAIELNPQVLAVCRQWFKLPPDGPKLRVVLADAAEEIKNPMWLGTVDALAVDLYDHEAAAPVLDSPDFYADCRALLTEDGCMTVNLFGRASSFERSLQEHGQRLWRRRAVGLQAHPRGQHRGAGAAHAQPAQTHRAGGAGRGHPGALGSALCQVAARVQTRCGLIVRSRAPSHCTVFQGP